MKLSPSRLQLLQKPDETNNYGNPKPFLHELKRKEEARLINVENV
jgi:hypothetical protein